MIAKNYSLRIEKILCKVNPDMYQKSDEILLNPYEEVISSLECRVPKENLDMFKLQYQEIRGRKLQELIKEKYNIDQLLKDLQQLVENIYP